MQYNFLAVYHAVVIMPSCHLESGRVFVSCL